MKHLTSLKIILCFFFSLLLPSRVWSQPFVIANNGSRVNAEKILVRPGGDLVVTINGQPRDILKGQYRQAVGVKPDGIEQAQALINEGKEPEAVKILEEIMDSSKYLSWDAFAGQKLAALQLRKEKPLEAKSTIEQLGRRYGESMNELFPFLEKILWDVRVASSDIAGLEEELNQVVKEEEAQAERKAMALIVRGDLKASRKEYESAVLDYLRANYFFGDKPEIQAEALYKTAQMFGKIGDTGRLNKYSALLKEKYPESEFTSLL